MILLFNTNPPPLYPPMITVLSPKWLLPEFGPIYTFLLPDTFTNPASLPTAVFNAPLILLYKAPTPIPMF